MEMTVYLGYLSKRRNAKHLISPLSDVPLQQTITPALCLVSHSLFFPPLFFFWLLSDLFINSCHLSKLKKKCKIPAIARFPRFSQYSPQSRRKRVRFSQR